jgi:hypothetical protein
MTAMPKSRRSAQVKVEQGPSIRLEEIRRTIDEYLDERRK